MIKYIYRIIWRFLFWIIVFVWSLFTLIALWWIDVEINDFELIDVLVWLWWVAALLWFWRSFVDKEFDYNLQNKPSLKLYGFQWKAIPTNHSEKIEANIWTCPQEDCLDIHLVNIRHMDWMDIKISSVWINKSKEWIYGQTMLELNSSWEVSKWWEYHIRTSLKNCDFLTYPEPWVWWFRVYCKYATSNWSRYNQIFYLTFHNLKKDKFSTQNSELAEFTSYSTDVKCFQWLNRLELCHGLWYKILYALKMKNNLEDDERLLMF